MRVQSRCWRGLQSSEGLTGAGVFACKVIHSHGWQVSGGNGQKQCLLTMRHAP